MKSAIWATRRQRQIMRLLASGQGKLYECDAAAYFVVGNTTEQLQYATLRSMIKRGHVERNGVEYPRFYYTLTDQAKQWLEWVDRRANKQTL